MGHALILVRHCDEVSGLSAWPTLIDLYGWQRTEGERPLTDRGRRQAEDLADRIAALEPGLLLCSPLTRARQTAAPLARATGLNVDLDPDLAEVSFGHLRAVPPGRISGIRRLIADFPLPAPIWPPLLRGLWLLGRTAGVDPPSALRRRAAELAHRLEARAAAGTTVVVSHGVVLLYLHATLLGDLRWPALRRRHSLGHGEFRVLERTTRGWFEAGRGCGRGR